MTLFWPETNHHQLQCYYKKKYSQIFVVAVYIHLTTKMLPRLWQFPYEILEHCNPAGIYLFIVNNRNKRTIELDMVS